MELYALTGRRQQAIRQYERLRDSLERTLDLEPEPESDDLYEAINPGAFPAETWEIEAAEPQLAPRPEITESIAEFLGRAGDFVGREDELGALQSALERVIGGQGEIILVAGEPGIGKTRMSEEFLRYASAQGVRTLWGRCYEGDGAPAYWPWVQVVRSYIDGRSTAELRTVMGPGAADIARIAPELRDRLPDLEEPPPLDPDGERFSALRQHDDFLEERRRTRAMTLIIDDLHSADRSSLLLLEFLSREIAETGLMVVGTYRHVEVDRNHPLTHTLGQLARHEANERITLDGLTVADIDRYVGLVTGHEAPEGLADAIRQQTEGNPFFVREIIALLVEEDRLDHADDVRSWRLTIPHGIRETIGLRAARLSDTAHRVLTTASVSGRTSSFRSSRRSRNWTSSTPWCAGGSPFDRPDHRIPTNPRRFPLHPRHHPPNPLRRPLPGPAACVCTCGRVRRLRAPTPKRSTDICPISPITFAAAASLGVVGRAVGYLRRAASQATERVAYAEAASYLRRAVDILSTLSASQDADHCDLLLHLGEALNATGDSTDAQAAFEHAAEIARSLADGRRLALAAVGIFEAGYYSAYDYRQFVEVLDEGLQGLAEGDPNLRVAILSRLATALQDSPNENERMRSVSDEAVRIANVHELSSELPFAMYARFLAYWSPEDSDNALERADELVAVSDLTGDTRMTLMGHAWRAFHLVERGDFAGAEEANDAYWSIAFTRRQRHYEWSYRLRLAMRRLMDGPLDEAERAIDDALKTGLRTWPEPARNNNFQQLFLLRRLQDRSSEIIDHGRELTRTYPDIPIWRCMLANLCLDINDQAQGQANVMSVLSNGLAAIPKDYFWLSSLALIAEALVRLNAVPRSDTESLSLLLRPMRGRFVSPGTNSICLGPVSLYLGMLAAHHREWKDAKDYFEDAYENAKKIQLRPFVAHAASEAARVALKIDGALSPKTAELIQEAEELIRDCGTPPARQSVQLVKSRVYRPSG